ncbi:MAG: MATE family efflux transporter [Sulfitobacter sp.]
MSENQRANYLGLLKNDLGRVVFISGPLLLSMSGHTIMMLVDRFCLAAYSENTLVASGPAVFTSMIAIQLFEGVTHIGRSLTAQRFASDGIESAEREGGTMFLVGIVCCLLLAVSMPLIIWLTGFSARPDEIISLERTYLLWAVAFGAIMIMNSTCNCFFGAIDKTAFVFRATLTGQVVAMVATYALVFGAFGMPELGMAGSAIGTLIGVLTIFAIYLYFLPSGFYKAFFDTAIAFQKGQRERIVSRIKRGLPIGAHKASDIFGNTAILWATSLLGTVALAANNFNIILNYISIIPILGIANGATILSSQAIGVKDFDRVGRILIVSILASLLYIGTVAAILQTFALEISNLFGLDTYDNNILDLSISITYLLWMYAVSFVLTFVSAGILQSFGRNDFVLRTRILIMWFGSVPAAFYLAYTGIENAETLRSIWISLSLFEFLIGLIFLAEVLKCVRNRTEKLGDLL